MNACRLWNFVGLLGCAGWLALTAVAQGQIKVNVDSPKVPTVTVGEWVFDGNSWQYKQPTVAPTPSPIVQKPAPVTGNTPGYNYYSQPLPANPTMQPYPVYKPGPLVQITIGSKSFSIGGAPPALPINRWVVTYKRAYSDPWNYYGFYATQAAAFQAGQALSQKGFYAGVTWNSYP